MLKTCLACCKDVGMATMSALNNQGESIERWEDVADGINEVNILFQQLEKNLETEVSHPPLFLKISKSLNIVKLSNSLFFLN